ncbi:hypothetical protein [Paratissierella segnis]|uniref:Uncharacterized protein n=1 Tax=Paratissierella segnis TaxID=2763679 RepID=A0A926EXI0_9FIRM|nr:hypothetical protein [Paratissierella segnis]MBC8588055.1 hypothetical protein [Paratissierella segnis]
MSKVLEITKLAMEINELGKHQVFVDISPHVKSMSISIYEGKWKRGNSSVFYGSFYYDESDKSDYYFIKRKLLEIKEKDLSGRPSFKVTDNQLNYSTNTNKVKQVRLISQEDYSDLYVFLSNMTRAIENNDLHLALSKLEELKKWKKTLKGNIGEV